jgi:hypothetical protein
MESIAQLTFRMQNIIKLPTNSLRTRILILYLCVRNMIRMLSLGNVRWPLGKRLCKIRDGFLADLRNVVVEKPFTVSTEEADRVIAAGKKSGKILTVFHSKILHPILL